MSRLRERASVEACQVLDVNALNRRDHLPTPPADETRVQVQVRDADGNWHTVTQYIHVDRVPRHFGGTQPYFICWCGRRVVKLYRGCGFYKCRQCHRLAYQSQQEDAFARAMRSASKIKRRLGGSPRAMRSASKIKRRLGGSPDWGAPFPPKPKGMWQRTYERLWCRFLEAEERAADAFALQAAALLSALGYRVGRPVTNKDSP
jgi:hypothetical protein